MLVTQSFWWGAAYVFIAIALRAFAPAQVVTLRTGLAAAALLAFALVTGAAARGALDEIRRRPGRVTVFAFVGSAAPFLLIAWGQKHVPAGLTGVLVASVPLWTALLALRLDRREVIDRRQWTGLLVGLVGVALVVGVDGFESPAQVVGVLAILLAAGAYALTNFMVTAWYQDVPAVTRSLFTTGGAALLTLPPAVAASSTGPIGWEPVLAVVLLGVGSTSIAATLGFKLVTEIGAGRAALATYIGPGFSLGLGAVFLGETITAGAVAGLGLIIAGVVVASGRRRTAAGSAATGAPIRAARLAPAPRA